MSGSSLHFPDGLLGGEGLRQVMGVDVTYETGEERNKNLTCLTTDGRILSREYREGLVDRHFSGWLEVRAVK